MHTYALHSWLCSWHYIEAGFDGAWRLQTGTYRCDLNYLHILLLAEKGGRNKVLPCPVKGLNVP